MGGIEGRLSGIEGRIGFLGQSFHEMIGEMARGFGQIQQHITRHEKRLEAVDIGVAALRTDLADGTARIIQEIRGAQPNRS